MLDFCVSRQFTLKHVKVWCFICDCEHIYTKTRLVCGVGAEDGATNSNEEKHGNVTFLFFLYQCQEGYSLLSAQIRYFQCFSRHLCFAHLFLLYSYQYTTFSTSASVKTTLWDCVRFPGLLRLLLWAIENGRNRKPCWEWDEKTNTRLSVKFKTSTLTQSRRHHLTLLLGHISTNQLKPEGSREL